MQTLNRPIANPWWFLAACALRAGITTFLMAGGAGLWALATARLPLGGYEEMKSAMWFTFAGAFVVQLFDW